MQGQVDETKSSELREQVEAIIMGGDKEVIELACIALGWFTADSGQK